MSDDGLCPSTAFAGDFHVRCLKRPHQEGDHVSFHPDGGVVWWPRREVIGTARERTPAEGTPLAQRARETAPVGSGSPSPFTGDQCQDCGSMNVVRTGTCGTCQNCGASTGCG